MSGSKGIRGVTLVELLIAMGLVAVVAAAAFAAATAGVRSFNLSISQSTGQQGLREAAILVTKQVHNAAPGAVTVGGGGTALTISGKQYTVTGDKLLVSGQPVVYNIKALNAVLTDKLLTVTWTATSGQTLVTKLALN